MSQTTHWTPFDFVFFLPFFVDLYKHDTANDDDEEDNGEREKKNSEDNINGEEGK